MGRTENTACLFNNCSFNITVEIMKITDGRGFDVIFDAAGGPNTLKTALEMVRVRGQVVMVAVPPQDRSISYVPVSFKEISLVGIRVYEYYDFQRAVDFLVASKLDLSEMFSVYSLDEYEQGFSLASKGDSVMRVLFRIGREK